MKRTKVVGLNIELSTIVAAVEAAHLLVLGELDTPADWTPKKHVAAILALIASRLELMRTVIRGEIDPAIACAEHCATVPEYEAADSDDGEVRLVAWTAKERIEKLRAELDRLGRRGEHGEE